MSLGHRLIIAVGNRLFYTLRQHNTDEEKTMGQGSLIEDLDRPEESSDAISHARNHLDAAIELLDAIGLDIAAAHATQARTFLSH